MNGGFEETENGPAYKEVLVDGAWTTPNVDRPQPPGWLTRVYAGDVRPGLDAQVRHGGSASATLESLSPQEAASGAIYQSIEANLQKGQDYTVTYWVRKTPLASTGISVWSDGAAHFESQARWDFQTDLSQWQKIQFCFQARRTTTKGFWILLLLNGVVGDQVWFDDVSCQLGRPEPQGAEAPGLAGKVPAAADARGYAFFEVHSFDEITPTHKPADLADSCHVTIDVCPGEFAAGALGVYAVRPLEGLRVVSDDLVGPEGSTIKAANVDLRVVKWWRQKRAIWTTQPPPCVVLPDCLIPELLLKDDRWNDENRPRGFGPEIRLTGPVVTDLPAQTFKQIWVTAHVPDATPPGSYKGSLSFETEGGPTSRADLVLNVLPFELVDPPEVLGAYVNTGYGFSRDPDTYPDSRYERKMRDLRDHGLNSVGILDGVGRKETDGEWVLQWDHLRRALEYRKEYGLDRFNMFEGFIWATKGTNPLYKGQLDPGTQGLVQWYVRALNQAVREAGMKPLTYYLIDEPHAHANGVRDTRRLGRLIQEAGGRTCTAVDLPTCRAIGPALDVPIVGLGLDTRKHLQALRDGQASLPEHPLLLCYWQFWEEHPLLNRYLFGTLLWASGLGGAIPYGYQHFGGGGDPYDDFDAAGKDMFVAYPSKNGPVATVQWEACREGINDLRYLRTLGRVLDRARRDLPAREQGGGGQALREEIRRARAFLGDLRERIQIVPTGPVRPPPEAQEYVRLRQATIGHILALESGL